MNQMKYEHSKNMKERLKGISYVMVVLLFASMFLVAKEAASLVVSERLKGVNANLVVIDAGHGADDSGKVGINGALEKDINLAIAIRVKELLESQDVQVVMTREDDLGDYPKTGSNRKVRDMKKRIEKINEECPALTVSIHQNSYTDESIHGAQTFYYDGSEEGKRAAEIMQQQLVATLDPENKRQAKANTSYYLLKKAECPIVIVECGFLSNGEEAALLCSEEYQEKTAWAIHMGILRCLNNQNEQQSTDSKGN